MSKCIPVGVVDDHNDALNFYYRLIARNKIPFDNLCLVHFDSHPDLATPESIQVKQFTNRHELLNNLTISDWILPAVYQGHFATVVWLKPPWATQIPVGKHEIELGVDEHGLLKTSSTLVYYVSDLSYTTKLENIRRFDLYVIEVSHLDENQENYKLLAEILRDRKWCLDFDMDFYSTQNPFLSILGTHFNFIDKIFKFEDFGDLHKNLLHRKIQLDCLQKLCESQETADSMELTEQQQIFMSNLANQFPNLFNSVNLAKLCVKDDEYITDLFYIGQQTELPHHVSTESEIRTLLKRTESLLKELDSVPVAITLARSEYDEYSAKDSLDFVHCELVCLIKMLFTVPPDLACPKL